MLTQERMGEIYDMQRNFDRSRGFLQSVTEHCFDKLQIEGRIPAEIQGTFYLAGPGNFDTASGEQYTHVFDGDGMIAAFSLDEGTVSFANRFIRTPAYEAEQRSCRRLFGSFGMAPPPGAFGLPRIASFKNSMNHGITWVNGRLLAVNDGGLPFEIDPHTLETIGVYDFNASLPQAGILASHLHWLDDPYEPYLLMTNLMGLRPSVTVYQNIGDRAVPLATHSLPCLTFIHDFALTRDHIVISVGSMGIQRVQLLKWLLGFDSLSSSFHWQKDLPNEILLLRRSDGALVRRYFTDPGFFFHFTNGYDDDDGTVVIDVGCYGHSAIITNHLSKFLRESSTSEEFRQSMPMLKRLRLSPDGSLMTNSFGEIAMEFAVFPDDVYARKHRFLYPLDVGCYARLLKLDTYTDRINAIDYGVNMFCSEAAFIRKRDSQSEDDGWLLNCVYDSADHHSFLSVVDAVSMTEVGRAHLPIHIPIRFHATFLEGTLLSS